MERLYSSQKTYVNTESFSLKLILTLSLFIALFQISELKAQTLIISKTGSISASPGEIINYTIQYANTGLVTATDVEITDYLPDPASYTYVSSFPAGVYDAANNKISWTKTEISSLSSLQATRGEITVQLRAGNTAANTYYYVSTSPTIADNYAGIESVEVSTPIISNNVFTTIDQYCGLTFSPVEVGEVKSNGGSGTRYLVNVINQGNIYDKFTIDTLQIGHPDQDKILEISVYDLSGNPLTETGWLAPGESFYFYVVVNLPIPTSANTFNYVDIIGTSNVCPGTSESTTIKTKIHNPAPNKSLLYLSKLDGTDPIAAGDTLDYVIYIYNYSDVATVNLRVTETYDANVSFLSATPSPDSGDNIWFLPPLAGGDYTTIEVRVIVDMDVPNGTILTNHVLADADNADEAKAVVTTTMVESYPDLDIQKTANPTIVGPQDFITYTINYANLGNLTAQNVSIVDDYDENNLSISSPNGGIDNGNTLTFNLPDLAPGATGSLTYIAKTKTKSNYSGGITVVTNTAQIQTTTLEANLNNNIAIELISVALLPDLDITLAASDEPANVNLPVTFTITVRNLGNYHSENVLIQNILPAGLTFVSASDGGILNAGIISWPILPLTHVVDVIERTFIAIPDCSAIPSVTNTASVANDLIETDYTNNAANLTSTIVSDFQFINCPTDQSVAMDAGICGALITFVTPSAEDECEGTLPVIRTDASGLNSGDVFPEGTTTISYSATNSKGITIICSFDITVGPDTEGPVIHNVPADVILECSDCIQSFENNDFEVPAISGSWASVLASDISGWETTAVDNRIEIQKSGGVDGVLSYSGNQHAELNGNNVGDFYQEFCTVPTTTVQISFAHHKRMAGINTSDDIMEVFSGSDLSNLISLGQFTATSTSGWTVHTVDFPIPPGQNSTVFVFRAIQGAPSNTTYGNLIDDINVITLFDATNVPYATDNCALESLSLYEEKIDGTCLNDYRVNRTWTAVDAAGNTTTATQSVIVGDVIGPDFSVPADITISCELDPADLTITGYISNLTDNCDPAPDDFNYSDVVTPGSCGNNSTIERTWTLTDHCNNSTSKIQIITVEDTTPPVFNETLPADLVIECGGVVPAIETLTVSDNCGTATFTYLQTLMPGACTGSFTISRTWLAKDECGNTSTHTQNIEYGDTTPPTASNPLPITVQCGSVPAPDVLVVNDEADNCSVIIVVAHVSDVSDGNTCPEIITRTYSVTDECANTLNVTQTITVGDTTPPTASNPIPITVQCGNVPVPDALVVTDEADNCSNPVVAFVSDVSDGNICPETITRTYSVTDDCGNTINVTQTITVGDTTPPTASNPLPITVQCTNVPAADISVVTDEADNCTANPVVVFVSDASDGNTCPETITRTYSVTDDCGNSIDVTQTITVDDNINPTASNPASITVQCISDVPAADISVVTNEADNCSANPIVAFVSDASDGNSCPETITRTYSITDDCGNSINVTQTITIDDNINPTASNPASITVQCISDIPAADILVVDDEADNCSANPIVAFVSDASDGNSCPETITRTYSVTDDCGNSVNVEQTITVGDTTPPTASNPASISVQCISDVPAADISVVTDEADNCSANPVVAFVSDASDGNTCPEIITRTYTVTDDCGNSINVTQTITVGDNINPTASNPTSITVQCGNVPAADISVVTDEADNCSNPVVAFVNDASDGNACPETITRIYSVTDDCGNSIDVTQTITVDDNINPTASNPAPISVQCITDVPAADISVVTDEADNCSIPVVAFVSDASNGNTCPETITRTYSVTDDCGNSIAVTQTITINDDIAPIFTTHSSDLSVESDGNGNTADLNNWLSSNGGAIASDNCSSISWTNDFTSLSDLCGVTGAVNVTFTATDACGNSSTTSAIFAIEDTTPPTLTGNALNQIVECDGSGNLSERQQWLTTNAGITVSGEASPLTWSYDIISVSDLCGLTSVEEVLFTVTDECGNSATASATFTIEDKTPPTIDTPAANLNVECDGSGNTTELNNWLSSNGGASASDYCSGLSWSNDFTSMSDLCGLTGIATVTFTATDDCGNSSTTSSTFTIVDTTNPTIDTPASNLIVECDGSGNTTDLNNWLSSNGGATASDNCSVVNWSNDFASVSDLCGLTGIANVTFTASDECGNSVTTAATFTIEDNTAPTIDTPASNLSVECDGGDNRAEFNAWIKANANASATDMCSGISWSSSIVSENDLCGDTKDILVEFVASDECGNSSTTSATFSIVDTTPPAWITPINSLDRFIECSATDELSIALALSPSALDNCGGGNVEHQSEMISECSGTYTITKTWIAIDNCGNASIPYTQVITVEDKTPPTVSTPASNLSVECDGNGNIADLNNWISSNAGATAFDNCVGISWTNDFTSLSDLCGLTGQALVTFTAIDECGNFVSTAATFTIVDTTPPVIDTPASNLNAECDGNGNTDEFNTWLTSNGGASASDDCSGVSWSNDFTSLSDLCGLTGAASVLFTATDDCGNSSSTSATFAIVDTTPPSWETSQGSLDITLDCADADGLSAALTLSPTASDICGDPVLSAPVEEIIESTCPNSYTLQRTWQLTDDCGNASAPFIQKIIVSDVTSPLTSDLVDTYLSCDDDNGMDIALSLIPSFTDNCTPQADIQIVLISDQTVNSCENTYVRTRVWQGNDLCGNTAISQQRIFVEDTTAPTADPLPSIYSYCINDYPPPSISSVKNAIDNCSETVSISFITDISDGRKCPEIITRTYSLVDDCGNESFVNQTIRINDTIPPTADQPEALIFSRIEDIPGPNIDILKNVSDNCTEYPVVSIMNFKTESPGDTPQVTHVYMISDECSNTKTVLHNIFVINNPEANDDVYMLEENSENNALPILINDLFGDDGPNETASLWLNSDPEPSYGEVTLNDNGTPSDAFDDFFVYTPDKYNLESDSFGYTIADKSGDEASAVVQISINPTPLHIPEAFSPNDDGINETFFIRGLEFYPNNSIVIYDKQGNMLYERSPYNNDWDGTNEFSSNPFEILPQATYFYILDLGIGERPIKGFVYINRYK